MKRITVPLLFLCLIALSVTASQAQTRPRRVGASAAPAPAPRTSAPEQSQAQSPQQTRRPPVLGGAAVGDHQPATPRQQPASGPEEVEAGDVIRVNTTLVSVPVSVMDRDGKYIPNLRKEDFRVWEDGVEQQVAYFGSTEKPFTVALVLDTSGSTRQKLTDIQEAAIAFVDQLRPNDRVMVLSFDESIDVLAEPTSDRSLLRDAIRRTAPGNGTRLYDAVDMVINTYFNRIDGRKAVVLFTDGVDTSSRYASYESNVRDAEEFDALIYPVEYDTYAGGRGGWGNSRRNPRQSGRSTIDDIIDIFGNIIDDAGGGGNGGSGSGGGRGGRGGSGGGGAGNTREEYERGDAYLNDLARVTGARLYQADNQNLSYAFRMVAEELRRQYSLGYYPRTPPQAGERRHIKVAVVNQPNLAVRTRDSYVFDRSGNVAAQHDSTQQGTPVLRKDFHGRAGGRE